MNNVIPTLKYVHATLRHKWFVLVAGLRLRVPLSQLLLHDLSKLTPAEAPHYGRQFYGDRSDPLGFARAWLHHQNVNPHHPEYWIPRSGHDRGGYPSGEPLPIPERYAREMVADWLGASRAYDGRWPQGFEGWPWWQKAGTKTLEKLHPQTRSLVLGLLERYFAEREAGT